MVIELKHVTKRIGQQTLLDDVSLQLNAGQVYGFAGANGAGKTVLLETIIGFVRPNAGTVQVAGVFVRRDQMFAPNIGFALGAESLLPMFDGPTNLALAARDRRHAKPDVIQNLMRRVGLNPQAKQKVKGYSLGMRQRLNIACALINDDPIVILDEPTNGLDRSGQQFLRELVSELQVAGKTVLLTSHDDQFLTQMCDEMFAVHEGRVSKMEAANAVD